MLPLLVYRIAPGPYGAALCPTVGVRTRVNKISTSLVAECTATAADLVVHWPVVAADEQLQLRDLLVVGGAISSGKWEKK